MKLTRQKILSIMLVVSVGLNLIVIGAAGFAAYRFNEIRGHPGSWIEKRLQRGERYFMRHLEEPDRQVAADIFNQHKPAIRQSFEELRAARRDFGQALRRDTPNSEEIVPILGRSQEAADRINREFHGLLRDMATQLSPEARQRLSAHLRRHHDTDDVRDRDRDHNRDHDRD